MQFPQKKPRTLQIGIHQQQGYFDFVWFDENDQPQYYQPFMHGGDIKTDFFQHLKNQWKGKTFPLNMVASISPHLTWSKTLILPQVLNAQECHQQCQFVIEKELPIPLNELWFDYVSMPLKQGFRLDVTAIRQSTATTFLQDFQPFKINVLDLAPHAMMRAFQYLLGGKARLENTVFLFQDDTGCLAIAEQMQQQQVLQSHENLTALFAQFSPRFEKPIEQVFVYQTPTQRTDLPKEWQRVETDFPFIALGNALWRKDLSHLTESTNDGN